MQVHTMLSFLRFKRELKGLTREDQFLIHGQGPVASRTFCYPIQNSCAKRSITMRTGIRFQFSQHKNEHRPRYTMSDALYLWTKTTDMVFFWENYTINENFLYLFTIPSPPDSGTIVL